MLPDVAEVIIILVHALVVALAAVALAAALDVDGKRSVEAVDSFELCPTCEAANL